MTDLMDRLKAALADRYAIERELGRGGMAVVYLARDLKHDRLVALKVLRPELAASIGAERFLREIEIAASLTHPHILPLYDSGDADGFLYYVMPYVEGESLRDRLSREKQLPVDEALQIAREVADALGSAHSRGVIHRDIKPENILLEEGHAVVADFGIARAVTAAGGDKLTETGMAIGTPAYMSPEQATGSADLDGRSDIYSLACMVYEMLVGEPPFTGPNAQIVLARQAVERVPSAKAVRHAVPELVEQCLMRALAKIPADRFKSADQFAQSLANAIPQAQALEADGSGRPPGTTEPVKHSNQLRRRVLVGLVAAAVLSSAIIFVKAIRDRNARVRWSRTQALPEVLRLIEEEDYVRAFDLARQAARYIPNDPLLVSLWPNVSRTISIHTSPSAASVFLRDRDDADSSWSILGETPLDSIRLPLAVLHVRIAKAGYDDIELLLRPWVIAARDTAILHRTLDETGSIPGDMVRVPDGTFAPFIPGLQLGVIGFDEYLIDKYEVTNKDFQVFVDSGGYLKPEYWTQPFVNGGDTVSWVEGVAEFVDATGRLGPATWELGRYPEGRGSYPVSGVSWYEAAAYAEFVGKSLPTLFHWNKAASPRISTFIVPRSNLSRAGGIAVVGQFQSVSEYGAYDMAGNVKEWVWNASDDRRYILGGAWSEPTYMFYDADARSPWDRQATHGFRLMQYESRVDDVKNAPYKMPYYPPKRDFDTEQPVPDDVFRLYARMYSYDRTPLNAVTESVDSMPDWTREEVSFDAAYGGERVTAFLFLPKRSSPPYQTVVYFPGSGAIQARANGDIQFERIDFIVQSGRAAVFPIYKGTYERGDALSSDISCHNVGEGPQSVHRLSRDSGGHQYGGIGILWI
jgi:serine/threonine protein kinase/formylglycine-generating enzyme required for sulfatase activity